MRQLNLILMALLLMGAAPSRTQSYVAGQVIDPADVTLIEWGFLIDEIDISTAAVAANTQGFALGRFQKTPQ